MVMCGEPDRLVIRGVKLLSNVMLFLLFIEAQAFSSCWGLNPSATQSTLSGLFLNHPIPMLRFAPDPLKGATKITPPKYNILK